jgi:uncharacterized protein (TIGR02246 family)
MFERFSEKARRVVFFARYEASQYGSPCIETEHLLLGLAREDSFVRSRFNLEQLRSDIEKHITRGERISTSIEVPLSLECRRVLELAMEEAERLANKQVDTGHLLLALMRVEESLAAKILREKISRELVLKKFPDPDAQPRTQVAWEPASDAIATLQSFLGGLRDKHAEQLASYFMDSGQFVDAAGRRWVGRQEIEKGFASLFAPFAKRRSSFHIEDTAQISEDLLVASLLWRDSVSSATQNPAMLRMSLVMAPRAEGWAIVLAQATFVEIP